MVPTARRQLQLVGMESQGCDRPNTSRVQKGRVGPQLLALLLASAVPHLHHLSCTCSLTRRQLIDCMRAALSVVLNSQISAARPSRTLQSAR